MAQVRALPVRTTVRVDHGGRGLVLDRCGSRSRRLSKNRQIYSEQLGGRYVTWSEPSGRVGLYDIRHRRRYLFDLGTPYLLEVAHTRTEIAVAEEAGAAGERHVYLARIADVARR